MKKKYLFFFIGGMIFSISIVAQVEYYSQYAIEMPVEAGPAYYDIPSSTSMVQQEFRINSKDPMLQSIRVDHFFYNYTGWPGPDNLFTFNFYEGTIDNPGVLVHSQPYSTNFIDPETGIEIPPLFASRLISMTDSITLYPDTDYFWEIKKPDTINWSVIGYRIPKCEGNPWKSNLGNEGAWFKIFGKVNSATDSTFRIIPQDSGAYLVDSFSNFFTHILLNKYQQQHFICQTSHAGSVTYHVSDSNKLQLRLRHVSPGVEEQISMVAMDTGQFTVYVVDGADSISYFTVHATEKRVLSCSYTYIKYPGESNHGILTAYDTISTYIRDVYAPVNVFIDFTDLGIKEYEWDLDGDSISWESDYSEFYGAMNQVPDSTFFSNFVILRENKFDSYFGGSNGGGTSAGFGINDSPPRYGLVAAHLFRTLPSLGSTLAHEIGHNLGLSHYSNANSNYIPVPNQDKNIMRVGNREDKFIRLQTNIIHHTINYFESNGESYESRAAPQFFDCNDTTILENNPAFPLPVHSNSDADLLFQVLTGKNVVQLDSTGQIEIVGEGVASIGVFAYATNLFLAGSDTMTITVLKDSIGACQSMLDFSSSQIPQGVHAASGTITANVPVANSGEVVLEGLKIILKPGFSTVAGNLFTARIAPCTALDDAQQYQQKDSTENYNLQSISNLTVFPNPFNDICHLQFNTNSEGYFDIILWNSTGNQITTIIKNQYLSPGFHQYQIDGLNLRPGVYFLTLQNQKNGEMLSEKLLLHQ